MTTRHRKLRKPAPDWKNMDLAYKAAVLVTQGKTTTYIAQKVFGSRSNTHINQVGELLQHAEAEGLFSLTSQVDKNLARDLRDWCKKDRMEFHVVKNDHLAYSGDAATDEAARSDAIARKAAEIVAERIAGLMKKRKSGPIVIANAGGFAVSRIVHFLPAYRLISDEFDSRRLLFISLNSAALPTDYGRSANVLAVRMAQIYNARHIVLSRIWTDEMETQYRKAIDEIDLLICGAGSRQSMLYTWLQKYVGVQIPDEAVGDICLIPISRDGREVKLARASQDKLQHKLNVNLDYSTLQSLAGHNKVIFVPMGFRYSEAPNVSLSTPEHSKLEVTWAVLKRSLTHTCILGNTLAQSLVKLPL